MDMADHVPAVSRSLRTRVITLLGVLKPEVAANVKIEQVFGRLIGEVAGVAESFPTSLDEDVALLKKLKTSENPLVDAADIINVVDSAHPQPQQAQGSTEKLNRYQCIAALVRRVEIKRTLVCAQKVLNTALEMLQDPNFIPEE
jgi:hypothetical protein